MSDKVSAVHGARFDGMVTVAEAGLQGMITLRGDLSSRGLRSAVKTVLNVDVPAANSVVAQGDTGACWMSPDELLLLCPHGEAEAHVVDLSFALNEQHHLVVNVSDARAVFTVKGDLTREVLAKLCPLDLSADVFKPGMIRRTRVAQVPAAIWMDPDGAFRVVCFRSVGQYVFDLLSGAAQSNTGVGVL